MAEVAADQTADMIFNAERAARLTIQSARNPELPGLTEVAEQVLNATLLSKMQDGYNGAIQRGVNMAVFRNMVELATHEGASPDVKAITNMLIENLYLDLTEITNSLNNRIWKAHYHYILGLIEQYKDDPKSFSAPPAPYTPPGSPIGNDILWNFECGTLNKVRW